jgi:PKD repeat protein
MKTIKLQITLFVLLIAGSLSAQCSTSYTWVSNGMTVYFTGNAPAGGNIVWTFGDMAYDMTNQSSVQHTYAQPGTYQACIMYYDSMQTCFDSTCQMVVVDSCYGDFSYTVNGLTVTFDGYASQSSANSYYLWNFHDNSSGSMVEDPTHTFPQAGTYNVCFAFYDQQSGCGDSLCQMVTVGGCSAEFSWIDSLGYVFFINSSTLGNSGDYHWDFGDGNYSTQYNPSHQYTSPGTYTVCLYVYDSLQNFCDSTCHTVMITNVGMDEISVAQNLQLAPNPTDGAFNVSWTLTQAGVVDISLYDLSGRFAKQLSRNNFGTGQQNLQFSTDGISAGTYILRMEINGHSEFTRLVVTHR